MHPSMSICPAPRQPPPIRGAKAPALSKLLVPMRGSRSSSRSRPRGRRPPGPPCCRSPAFPPSHRWDSDPQPAVYKTAALPVELRWRTIRNHTVRRRCLPASPRLASPRLVRPRPAGPSRPAAPPHCPRPACHARLAPAAPADSGIPPAAAAVWVVRRGIQRGCKIERSGARSHRGNPILRGVWRARAAVPTIDGVAERRPPRRFIVSRP